MSVILVNDSAVLDTESHSVIIQLDRITLSLEVEEFLDFYRSIVNLKEYLESSPDYLIGQETDQETGEIRDVILPRPDEDEYT